MGTSPCDSLAAAPTVGAPCGAPASAGIAEDPGSGAEEEDAEEDEA